ncbi:MAG: hypothetical protein NZM35_12345 [Chitinophagales bacterium]|nr:hypothetical protein [Chitinophagales bacterium]MDW8420207.1 hypothetical protein [Chitinophagales bacterium]
METLDSAASSLDFMFMKRYPMTDMAVVLLKHMYLCSPQDQLTQIESLYNSYPLGFLKFYGIDGLKNNFNVLPINPVVLKLLKKYNIHSSGRNLLLFVDTDCYFCKLWLKNKVQLDTVFDRVYIFILNKTDEFKGRRYIHVKHGEFNKYLAPLRICSVPYVLVTYGDIIEESDRANVVKRYNLKIE